MEIDRGFKIGLWELTALRKTTNISTRSASANLLLGKAALVTGGAQRVGRAIALRLAEAGMDVAITYQSSVGEAREVVEEIERLGRRAVAIRADLAKPQAAEAVHRAFVKEFDRLDALVNNASVFAPGKLDAITVTDFERNMAVNARSCRC